MYWLLELGNHLRSKAVTWLRVIQSKLLIIWLALSVLTLSGALGDYFDRQTKQPQPPSKSWKSIRYSDQDNRMIGCPDFFILPIRYSNTNPTDKGNANGPCNYIDSSVWDTSQTRQRQNQPSPHASVKILAENAPDDRLVRHIGLQGAWIGKKVKQGQYREPGLS